MRKLLAGLALMVILLAGLFAVQGGVADESSGPATAAHTPRKKPPGASVLSPQLEEEDEEAEGMAQDDDPWDPLDEEWMSQILLPTSSVRSAMRAGLPGAVM